MGVKVANSLLPKVQYVSFPKFHVETVVLVFKLEAIQSSLLVIPALTQPKGRGQTLSPLQKSTFGISQLQLS